MTLPLSQYSIQCCIYVLLDFKCLAILGPSLEILYLFCILFNASLCLFSPIQVPHEYMIQYYSTHLLANPSYNPSTTALLYT